MADSFVADSLTYEDLPSGVPEGSLARVTSTAAKGVYIYKTTIDTYTVNMWFPLWLGDRISGYAQDGSSNPVRLSTGIGGETLSTLTSRGWTVWNNVNGTVTDGGDGTIFFDTTTGTPNGAGLSFTPVVTAGLVLWVIEMESLLIDTPGAGRLSNSVLYYDGTRRIDLSFCGGLVSNRIEWLNVLTPNGDGLFSFVAYDRIFLLIQIGNVANSSGLCHAWLPKLGYQPKLGVSDAAALYKDFSTNSLSPPLYLYCEAASGSQSTMKFKEFHAFEIS